MQQCQQQRIIIRPLVLGNNRSPMQANINVLSFIIYFVNFLIKQNICMAQFFISLPNNRQGNVRTGIKRREKKNFFHVFLPWKKLDKEEKLAYIVEVTPMYDIQEYRLLKTKDGHWLRTGDDKWLREGEGSLNTDIKNAIDAYEHGTKNK